MIATTGNRHALCISSAPKSKLNPAAQAAPGWLMFRRFVS
jgi:hypothetical protein